MTTTNTSRLEQLKARLALYLTAETEILTGAQSSTVGGVTINAADLSKIQTQIDQLQRAINRIEHGGCEMPVSDMVYRIG